MTEVTTMLVPLLAALSALAGLWAGWQAGHVHRLRILSRPVPARLRAHAIGSLTLFFALWGCLVVSVVLSWVSA
jgi:hypothetical protein